MLYCSAADKNNTQNCVTDQEYKRAKKEYEGYKHYNSSLDDVKDVPVKVTQFRGDYVNRFHIGISVGNQPFVGYTIKNGATDYIRAGVLQQRVPGAVKPIVPPQLDHPVKGGTATLNVTPEQAGAIEQYIFGRTENPGQYQLEQNNCSEFACDALHAGEVPVGRDELPSALIQDLLNIANEDQPPM